MKRSKTARTLEQFAAADRRPHGTPCWMCALEPQLRKQIEGKHREDPRRFTVSMLARYLRDELKLDGATRPKLAHHLSNHVAA